MPPTTLEVKTAETTTNSVKVAWTYDSSKSHSVKWTVKYEIKGSTGTKEITTDNVDEQEVTIPDLASGQTYTIRVFGVTTGDVNSQTSTNVEATVSKYIKCIRK